MLNIFLNNEDSYSGFVCGKMKTGVGKKIDTLILHDITLCCPLAFGTRVVQVQ